MIKIYGHSDDLLEIEGEFISEENEISCWRKVVCDECDFGNHPGDLKKDVA